MEREKLERLQKILSAGGIASRRDAEKLILAGRVTVDGLPAELGQRACMDTQTICVDGQPLSAAPSTRTYIMLHKPKGYLSTVRDDRGRKTVMDLLGEAGRGLWPVGRLDLDSEGLLILTNDGELTKRLTHPSFEVKKTYKIWASGRDFAARVEALKAPLIIDDSPISPAAVRLVRELSPELAVLEISIHEGRNRQVRKMCAMCDLKVHRLMRTAVGNLQLGSLKSGEWRYLTSEVLDVAHGGL